MQIVDIKDFIGVGITGLLGLLWFDIRGIRKEREAHKEKIDEKFKGYLKEKDIPCFVRMPHLSWKPRWMI